MLLHFISLAMHGGLFLGMIAISMIKNVGQCAQQLVLGVLGGRFSLFCFLVAYANRLVPTDRGQTLGDNHSCFFLTLRHMP